MSKRKRKLESALEVSRLDLPEPIAATLTCSICSNVFLDPISLPCDHTFCDPCIEQWRKGKSTCPLCQQPFTQTKPVSLMVRQIFDAVQARCRYFPQCATTAHVTALHEHEDKCPFRPVSCPHALAGCATTTLPFGELPKHLEQCGFAEEACPLGCGRPLLRNAVGAHKDTCGMVPTPCGRCSDMIPRDKMDHHHVNSRIDPVLIDAANPSSADPLTISSIAQNGKFPALKIAASKSSGVCFPAISKAPAP